MATKLHIFLNCRKYIKKKSLLTFSFLKANKLYFITIANYASTSGSAALKGAVTGSVTQIMSNAVDIGVASHANNLMPELTPGFGEGLKAFFGWADDALVYLWE